MYFVPAREGSNCVSQNISCSKFAVSEKTLVNHYGDDGLYLRR